jgi:hypothetical protein
VIFSVLNIGTKLRKSLIDQLFQVNREASSSGEFDLKSFF